MFSHGYLQVDLAVHKKKVAEVQTWLQECVYKKTRLVCSTVCMHASDAVMCACTCSLFPSFCMIPETELMMLCVVAHFVAELAVVAIWMLMKALGMLTTS